MRAFKTEGIILKRKNFGEADRILTVFTVSKGKVSVLARGVRKITSRRAGNIELLNRVQMYLHQGKNFLILTEASSINTFQKLKEDLTLSTYAYHILEATDKLTAENQENSLLYTDLVEVLNKLSEKPRQILVRAYEVKVLTHMGFWSVENLQELNSKIKELLQILEYGTWDQIENVSVNQTQALELERILRYYLEKIIESPLKSRQLLKK